MTKKFNQLVLEISRRGMLGGLVGSLLSTKSDASDYVPTRISEKDFITRLESLVSYIETGIRPNEIKAIRRNSNADLDELHQNRFKNSYSIAYGNKNMGDSINKHSYWVLDKIFKGAKGKYQIIATTFKDLEQSGLYSIVPSAKTDFSPSTQDKIFFFMRSKKANVINAVKSFTSGDVDKSIYYLSREWASIPKDKTNASYYAGDKINSALVDFNQVKQFLVGSIGINQVVKLTGNKHKGVGK